MEERFKVADQTAMSHGVTADRRKLGTIERENTSQNSEVGAFARMGTTRQQQPTSSRYTWVNAMAG